MIKDESQKHIWQQLTKTNELSILYLESEETKLKIKRHLIMDVTHHKTSLMKQFKLHYKSLDDDIRRSCIGYKSKVPEKLAKQNKMKWAFIYIQSINFI